LRCSGRSTFFLRRKEPSIMNRTVIQQTPSAIQDSAVGMRKTDAGSPSVMERVQQIGCDELQNALDESNGSIARTKSCSDSRPLVSHDLREPLRMVSAYAHLLSDRRIPKPKEPARTTKQFTRPPVPFPPRNERCQVFEFRASPYGTSALCG
jgi:hypothetical protein